MKTKIDYRWLEVKDLDAKKIRPHLPPMYNAVLQFGFEIEDPKIKELFMKPPTENDKAWFSKLGWDEKCYKLFWKMLMKKYAGNKKEVYKWLSGGWNSLSLYRKEPSWEFILDGPISSKDIWLKNKGLKTK